jgi:hypothetical protein
MTSRPTPLSGSVLNSVMCVGQVLSEFLVAGDLHLGKLQAEFEPQKNGEPCRERADELFVPLADAAQFAGCQKSRLAEIVSANVGGLATFAHALGGQHKHVAGFGRGCR